MINHLLSPLQLEESRSFRVSLTKEFANLVKVHELVAPSGGTTWLATLYSSSESHFFPQT